MSNPIQNRYDIVYFFDVKDGNPNGDPDAANLPRSDPETGQGLVTDVCLKRKVRNFVDLVQNGSPGFRIFVREGAILNAQIEEAYTKSPEVQRLLTEWQNYEKNKKKKNAPKPPKPTMHYEDIARQWLCEQFFDIRTFGAVLSTGKEKSFDEGEDGEEVGSKIRRTAGQVRGPVQFGFARSVHRILSQEHALTVCAARMEEKPVEQQVGIQGRKSTVPYGLYRVHIYVSAPLADPARKGSGFSEDDLNLVRRALNEMFDHDHAAARANMSPVRGWAFKHECVLGNARSDKLFDLVKAELTEICRSENRQPRSKHDYVFTVPAQSELPPGVTIEEWV